MNLWTVLPLLTSLWACAPREPTDESVSDTGPTPEWVTQSVTVAFVGETCARGFDAVLPGDPWRRYAWPDGCDEAVLGTQDIYGNRWYFFFDCNDFPLARDPLFGPSAEWINAADSIPPPCPEDPSFSWTYPEELLAAESE